MSTLFAFFGMGHWELLIVAGVMILLFGHRLPSVMRSMGSGIREFKEGMHGNFDEDDDAAKAIDEKKQPS